MPIASGARAEDIEAQRRAYLDAYPEDRPKREAICFDFSDCAHTAETIIEVKASGSDGSTLGAWGVALCARCGTQTAKECAHTICVWNEDGTLLTCRNCGIDGT